MNMNEETAGRWYAPPRAVLREPAHVKWEKLTYEKHFLKWFDGVVSFDIPILTVKEFTPDTTTISVKWVNTNVQICDD